MHDLVTIRQLYDCLISGPLSSADKYLTYRKANDDGDVVEVRIDDVMSTESLSDLLLAYAHIFDTEAGIGSRMPIIESAVALVYARVHQFLHLHLDTRAFDLFGLSGIYLDGTQVWLRIRKETMDGREVHRVKWGDWFEHQPEWPSCGVHARHKLWQTLCSLYPDYDPSMRYQSGSVIGGRLLLLKDPNHTPESN